MAFSDLSYIGGGAAISARLVSGSDKGGSSWIEGAWLGEGVIGSGLA